MKCFQTVIGFRKECVGAKCALHIVLYSKDENDKIIEKPMCCYRANAIAQLDTANAISKLSQKG